MDQSKLSKAKKIIEQLGKLSTTQRQQEMEKLCGSDVDLRESVERLLKSNNSGKQPAPSPSVNNYEPRIAGYEIIGQLGEGGMGVVWEAVQLSTRRRVALKLLSQASLGSERRRSRFVREVELAASLEHPNIARVYDSGLDKGVYYYAMQLVKGLPLDAYAGQRALNREQILRLMKDVCNAMQYAHERGVVHRDLKPSNILVDKSGQPQILDFGLAKMLDSDDGMALSVDGDVTGTPMFMSPEQAAGNVNQISARTDVYALGVMAYRLLTGEAPHDYERFIFAGDSTCGRRGRAPAESPRAQARRGSRGDPA